MKLKGTIIIVISIYILTSINTSCSFPYVIKEVDEDFEDQLIDENLSLILMGDSFAVIEEENKNSYLLLGLSKSTNPDNKIFFGYNDLNDTLFLDYSISYDIYIEEIDNTGVISTIIQTAEYESDDPEYLFFSREEGVPVFHSGTEDYPFNNMIDSGYSGYSKSFLLNQWIHVNIGIINNIDNDYDEDNIWYEIHVGPSIILNQSYDVESYQNFFIEAHSGIIRYRIDNVLVEFN